MMTTVLTGLMACDVSRGAIAINKAALSRTRKMNTPRRASVYCNPCLITRCTSIARWTTTT